MTDIEELDLTPQERGVLRRADENPEHLTAHDQSVLGDLLSEGNRLSEGPWAVRRTAIETLSEGSSVVSWDSEALRDPLARVLVEEAHPLAPVPEVQTIRRDAASLLGQVAETDPEAAAEAVDPLIAATSTTYVPAKREAVEALGRVGRVTREAAVAVVDPLLGALDDGDESVRCAAAEALGRGAGSDDPCAILAGRTGGAVEALVTTLSDEEGDVRAAAARALGRLGAAAPGTVDDAVGPLSVALADHEVAVRRTAAEAFGRIGREHPGTVTGSIGPLVATLEDDHSTVRREGARALARIGETDPDAVVPALDPLLDALGSDAHPVRAAAATALGHVAPAGDETTVLSATERLVAALDDDHDDVRESVAIAFGRLHAHDSSHDLDEEALLTLGERLGVDDLDTFLVDQFTPRLDDHCTNVAVAAAFAVFRGGDTDHDLRTAARDRLREGLASHEWPLLTARLVAELAATGPAMHPMMREMFSPDDAEDDPAVRDLVPDLVALLDSPLADVRRHACRALGHLGTTAARADLERVAEDDDRAAVREAAETALGRLDGGDDPSETDRATADDGDAGASGTEAAGDPGTRTAAADAPEQTADEHDATTETSRDSPVDGLRADTDPESGDHGGAVESHSSLADRAALYARLLEYARMESLRECRRWARELRGFVEANPVDDEGYAAAREQAVALDEERLPAATSAFGEDHDIVTGDQFLADAAPELHEDIGDVAFVVRRCYVRQG